MDTNTPHGELLFSLFGALAQYERALTRERVMAGLAAAKRRGRQGGRPPMIDTETLERITAALAGGADRKSVVWGKGVSGRVAHGGRRFIKKRKIEKENR